MTRSELYHLLSKPQDVREEHIPALERLVEAYPYAASFIQLYLYALAKGDDVRYSSELRRLVAFLPSRQSLYALITGQGQPKLAREQRAKAEDAFSLIDDFLQVARTAGEDLPEDLHFSGTEGADYFASHNDLPLGEELVTAPLIRPQARPAAQPSQGPERPIKEGQDEEQDLFTETLAKIYIQQGKYERALGILENLNLHYPQKNRYFADQIRFLRRLVENNRENKDDK